MTSSMLSPRQKETSALTSEGKAGGWGLFWATSETFSKKGEPEALSLGGEEVGPKCLCPHTLVLYKAVFRCIPCMRHRQGKATRHLGWPGFQPDKFGGSLRSTYILDEQNLSLPTLLS